MTYLVAAGATVVVHKAILLIACITILLINNTLERRSAIARVVRHDVLN